ncbi:uncharacterized protein UV8b_06520 [Ustilaginoidea virens]|uniref:Uncharacterized protein n=1 Tax=Ustilaginoidea virens TaxID=1159556 RepID=A0A8E5HVA7_USTVR|nr:uncharacterized protein UV8b_06520 [Ustilaginoidea virens]QUC22279.1 hypothetical protein UV8b_06520 [Ustilaginoidea virens]
MIVSDAIRPTAREAAARSSPRSSPHGRTTCATLSRDKPGQARRLISPGLPDTSCPVVVIVVVAAVLMTVIITVVTATASIITRPRDMSCPSRKALPCTNWKKRPIRR